MAVDTPTKRSSALNVRTRCRRFLPVPDGTIAVSDRAHLAGVYYEAVVVTTTTYAGPLGVVTVCGLERRGRAGCQPVRFWVGPFRAAPAGVGSGVIGSTFTVG